jgi:3-hydroxyacyl-CoA dehydrogenase / enoyl-CoA hydratase / 3-hydroxybutyryl-CoA epimerase / enoyl-CoA isomerase
MGNAFHLEEIEGQIAVLTFDLPDKKVNTFSKHVVEELIEVVGELEKRSDLRGLLIKSGKKGQFIAGADLKELGALAYATIEQAQGTGKQGHDLFNRISALPFPTVALIDGNCMGGGTEMVLSMDYRLASDSPKTKIALPEVKIGLLPGWGGTQRMPRVIGVHNAIDLICSGKAVGGRQAADLGLVFDSVPAERLIEEGCRLIEHAHESGEWKPNREKFKQPMGLSEDQMAFNFAIAEGGVYASTKGNYPAPLAALKAIKEGINLPLEQGLENEQKCFAALFSSPTVANLIGMFFINNQLAADSGVEDKSVKPMEVKSVGTLGGGQMGAGIASTHARAGVPTTLVDISEEQVQAGMGRCMKVVSSRIKAGRATHKDMENMLCMLTPSTSTESFKDADVVVEAVTENEELKTKIYKQLGEVMKKDAILASNTSTISITRMAESSPNPEKFIGMHFFFPVDRMQLVEVIRGEKTSDETVATIVALSKKIRKTPIVVNDCAGFLVNRVLLPYMNEALILLQEGASMDAIDKACTKFGMPVGPIALQDMVGLDTSCFAGQVLQKAYSDRTVKVTLLEELVKAGRLGKKTGSGFRKYVGPKMKPAPDPDFDVILEKCRTDKREFTQDEITDRLFLPMLLEAVTTLEDDIVREPSHVDMGLILGIGFPPFKGGILRWCDTVGASNIIEKAAQYENLGKRYAAPEMLKSMASSGKLFYPRP